MKDLTRDLASQIRQFREWRRTINRLRARGLPKGLVDQILALGPEQGGEQARLLAKATPAQLKEYKRLWKAGQKDVHDATMRDVRNQLNSWRRHGRQIGLAIARGLRDENAVLERSLRAMILRAFPALKAGVAPTPASVPSTTINRTTTTNNTTTNTSTEAQKAKERFIQEEHIHYHIVAPKDEHASVKTQIRHAHFAQRNRFHHKN